MKTLQEIFNITVLGLRAQGRQSLDKKGLCMYRGENGTKCAAGFHIPDELYTQGIECCKVDSPSVLACLDPEIEDTYCNRDFLSSLQTIHDWNPDNLSGPLLVSLWNTGFERLAKANDLTMPA